MEKRSCPAKTFHHKYRGTNNREENASHELAQTNARQLARCTLALSTNQEAQNVLVVSRAEMKPTIIS